MINKVSATMNIANKNTRHQDGRENNKKKNTSGHTCKNNCSNCSCKKDPNITSIDLYA